MKLQRPPGTQHPASFRHKIVFRQHKGGGQVVTAWPRPRGRKLQPIQQHQVKTWDTVMKAIKYADIIDVRQATDDTLGTAYYVRDILTQCAFGAYVSWPGFGPYPNGGYTGPVPMPRSGRKARAAAQLANPQQVNVVTQTRWDTTMQPPQVTFTLAFPAAPDLFVWDIEPTRIEVPVKRKNKKVNHGKKPFFNEHPTVVSPISTTGNQVTFEFPQAGPVPSRAITRYCVARLGSDSKSKVSFSTTARQVNGIWLVVDLLLAANIADVEHPQIDLDLAPADPQDRLSTAGWPIGTVIEVDYDNFPQGLAPEGPYKRRTYALNLSPAAPPYQGFPQRFPSGIGNLVADGQFVYGLDVRALAPNLPGVIRVRGYRDCADLIVSDTFTIEPVGGKLAFSQQQQLAAPNSGSILGSWLLDETGIIAFVPQVFP